LAISAHTLHSTEDEYEYYSGNCRTSRRDKWQTYGRKGRIFIMGIKGIWGKELQ
jgi:hypothetical protein